MALIHLMLLLIIFLVLIDVSFWDGLIFCCVRSKSGATSEIHLLVSTMFMFEVVAIMHLMLILSLIHNVLQFFHSLVKLLIGSLRLQHRFHTPLSKCLIQLNILAHFLFKQMFRKLNIYCLIVEGVIILTFWTVFNNLLFVKLLNLIKVVLFLVKDTPLSSIILLLQLIPFYSFKIIKFYEKLILYLLFLCLDLGVDIVSESMTPFHNGIQNRRCLLQRLHVTFYNEYVRHGFLTSSSLKNCDVLI